MTHSQPPHHPATEQYLQRYAEPEIAIARSVPGHYAHVLVVPTHQEDVSLLRGLSPALSPHDLLILVVNGTCAEDNEPFLTELTDLMTDLHALGQQCTWGRVREMPLVLVDRGASFGAKDGVGLARKIGADLALALYDRGAIASAWIHMTDADATLPEGYFEATERIQTGGYCYPFLHVPGGDLEVDHATQLYDQSLRYYVAGLTWAGSTYAYHSIGSTIAVHARSYAGVRGMPRRQAGEDFYLLNKLAKTDGVTVGQGPPVKLRARRSNRVPFGTGPAVDRIAREGLTTYDPRCFEQLAQWLRKLETAAQSGDGPALRQSLDPITSQALAMTSEDWSTLEQLLDQPTPRQRERRVLEWFDAFRTLKFIHALRDQAYPNRPWAECLKTAPFPLNGPEDGSS